MTVPTKSRFQRYVTVIARWLLVTGSVFSVTFFTGNYITDHCLTKYYSATAQIEIRDAAATEGGIPPAELETILSAEVLLPVIKDLSLDTEWNRRIFKSPESTPTDLETISQMDKMLRVAATHGTDIVNITVIDDVPTEAADIANAIADRYKTLRDTEVEQETSAPGPQGILVGNDQRETSTSLPTGTTFPAVMIASSAAPATTLAVLRESSVRIVSRADVPATPSRPNKNFCFYVTLIAASLLSLMAASFVEVIFLFLRAAKSAESLPEIKPRSLPA